MGKYRAYLAVRTSADDTLKCHSMMFRIYRPNTGLQSRTISLAEIEKSYVLITAEKAEKYWKDQYDLSVSRCR